MKRQFSVILFLCLTGAILYFFLNSTPKPAAPNDTPAPVVASANAPASSAKSANSPTAIAASEAPAPSSPANNVAPAVASVPPSAAAAPEYTAIAPAAILENMRAAVTLYGHTFGGNPVGTNPEITSALNGNNPKQIKFLQPDAGMRINGNGELIDPWGTPVFFHQLSGSQTEIRFAGPDRKMWTSDDLVIE